MRLRSLTRHYPPSPGYADAIFQKGRAYIALQNPDGAIRAFDRALEINPSCYQAHYWKARTLYDEGSYDAAISEYDRAIAIKPDSAEFTGIVALLMQRSNSIAMRSGPTTRHWNSITHGADAFSHKGTSLAELGMYRDALEAFEKALEKNRGFAAAWFGKGNVLYDLGKFAEARDAYDEGLRLDPENAVGWTRQGDDLCRPAGS